MCVCVGGGGGGAFAPTAPPPPTCLRAYVHTNISSSLVSLSGAIYLVQLVLEHLESFVNLSHFLLSAAASDSHTLRSDFVFNYTVVVCISSMKFMKVPIRFRHSNCCLLALAEHRC